MFFFLWSTSVARLAVNNSCGVPVPKQLITVGFEIKTLNIELSHLGQRADHKLRVCVSVCMRLWTSMLHFVCHSSIYTFFPDCTTGHVTPSLFMPSPPSLSSFSFLLFVSFTLCLASVQVLAVVSFRKRTAFCWEVRYLPLGQPPFFFLVIFIGCLREAELLRAHRTVHSALVSFSMIVCRVMHILAGFMDIK